MTIVFEFSLLEGFPHLEKVNPYEENGKKFHVLCLDNIDCFRFENGFAYLLIPDDNSDFANYSKKFINDKETKKCFSIPANCLKLKLDLFKKASVAGSGLVVKDTSQVKEIRELSTKKLTFKVVKSIKSGLDRETLVPNYTDVKAGEPYAYILEIEPLNLGIEGILPITRITFFLSINQDPITGERSLMNFREKHEKLVSEAAGKELTLEVKKWMLSKQNEYYNTLEFREDNDFNRIEERKIDNYPNNNNLDLSQIQSNFRQTITKLLTDNNLETSDLSTEFHNWETDLNKLDDKEKIKEFQWELEKEIKTFKSNKGKKKEVKNENKNLSLPVKLLIGGGVVVVLGLVGVFWYLKKTAKES